MAGGNPTQLALGMSMRFHVVIDGVDLGSWSTCKGLEVVCKLEKLWDPGDYSYEHILFANVQYSTIKLERAMEKNSSKALRDWLADKLSPWSQPGYMPEIMNQMGIGGSSATITLLDSGWTEVSAWTLRNVYPKGWYGPNFDAGKSAVAIERLELDHEGFLEAGGGLF
jgi:phage tail-like protein